MMEPRDLQSKKPGDFLEASHVNVLSEAAKRAGIVLPGTGQMGTRIGNNYHIASKPDVPQNTFRITEELGGGLYKGHCLWYSEQIGAWKPTDAEWNAVYSLSEKLPDVKEWTIDGGAVNLTLTIGSYVVCIFNPQRGYYIPVVNNTAMFVLARLETTLYAGSSATARIYDEYRVTNGVGYFVLGEDVITIHDFFFRNSNSIALAAYYDVLAMYYSKFNLYILINCASTS